LGNAKQKTYLERRWSSKQGKGRKDTRKLSFKIFYSDWNECEEKNIF
jgi:hypothetical protein